MYFSTTLQAPNISYIQARAAELQAMNNNKFCDGTAQRLGREAGYPTFPTEPGTPGYKPHYYGKAGYPTFPTEPGSPEYKSASEFNYVGEAQLARRVDMLKYFVQGPYALGGERSVEEMIRNVDVRLIEALYNMAKDYNIKIEINWGFRDATAQSNVSGGATQGTSWHEYGGAVDVDMTGTFGALNLKKEDYARYGLVQAELATVPGSTWHFQLVETGIDNTTGRLTPTTDSKEGSAYQNSITTWGQKYG